MYTPAKFLQVADLATGLAREWVVRHVDIPEGSKSLLAFRISLGHLHQDSEVLDLAHAVDEARRGPAMSVEEALAMIDGFGETRH